MAQTTRLAESNIFLLPNGTFFVELIIFFVVLFIMWRFVVPPITKAMADRQEMVRKQAEEAKQATEKFAEAQQRYQDLLGEARAEAAEIRDAGRAEGQRIIDELRQRANAEADQVIQRGADQLAAQRAEVLAQLRPHVGELAVSLAGRVTGGELPARAGQAAELDRLVAEYDEKRGS